MWSGMMRDPDLVERLGHLTGIAEGTGNDLRYRCRLLCANYLVRGFDALDQRERQTLLRSNPRRPTDIDNLSMEIDPRRDYRARMESHFHALLRELPERQRGSIRRLG